MKDTFTIDMQPTDINMEKYRWLPDHSCERLNKFIVRFVRSQYIVSEAQILQVRVSF